MELGARKVQQLLLDHHVLIVFSFICFLFIIFLFCFGLVWRDQHAEEEKIYILTLQKIYLIQRFFYISGGKDKNLDYEYDSEAEWEPEDAEEGDECNSIDEDKDEEY